MSLPGQFAAEDAAKVNDPAMQQWRPEFVPTPAPQQAQASQSVQPVSGDINTQLQAKLAARKAGQAPQEPQKNFLQNMVGGFTDTAATGIRAVQGLGRGVQAIGQTVIGDKEGALETMRKADEDIYKPVRIPLLGQGNIRKLGTVNEKGIIVPSTETLKTAGTAADVASFFMNPTSGAAKNVAGKAIGGEIIEQGVKAAPSIAKQRFVQGSLQAGGSKLAETGDVGQAAGSALLGGGLNVGMGKVIDVVGNKFGKDATKIGDAINPNTKAQQSALDDYASAIGIKKSFYTNEAKKAAGKSFKDPKEVLRTMLEDGIELKAKNEGGRNIFDTIGNIESLKAKTTSLEDQLQSVIASRPQKRFNLNVIATKAKSTIKGLGNVTAVEKNKMLSKIDEIIQAEKVANGYKKGSMEYMSRSAFVDGSKANELKRGLYNMANFEKQTTGSDTHLKTLANVLKDSIETAYKSVEDVAALNKEYGRALEQIDFLTGLNGQVVQGGRLPKLASRALGAGIGMATPIPLPGVKEYVGSEIGGKIHDVMTDPARLTRKAIGAFQKASGTEAPSALAPMMEAISDRLSTMGLPAAKRKIIMDALPDLTDVLMMALNKTAINPVSSQDPNAELQPQEQPQEDINAVLMQKLQQRKAAQ